MALALAVQPYEGLWNMATDDYRKSNTMMAAWESVSITLGVSAAYVNTKMGEFIDSN
jgi:hypothetical protein